MHSKISNRYRLARRRGWKARYQQIGTGAWTPWVAYPGHDRDINRETVAVLSWQKGARRFRQGMIQMGETARKMVTPLSEFAKAYNDHPASVSKRSDSGIDGFSDVKEYTDRALNHKPMIASEPDLHSVVTLHSLPTGVALLDPDDDEADFADLPVRNIPKDEPDVIKFNELTVPQLREHARDYSQAMSVQLPKGFAKFRRAQMIQWMTDNMEGA